MTSPRLTESTVRVAGGSVHLMQGGVGEPLLVLHHDVGTPGWTPFYELLARRFTVYVPSHPGYGKSERPTWMRSVRDVAIVHQWLLKELALDSVSLVGLGFGGWIAAEMATMAPRQFRRLVLVGAMGIKPADGEILDQALIHYVDYVKAGLHDATVFDRVFGAEPDTDQLETWDLNREMTFRIAWKPYMYNPTLPHLLGGTTAPALVVWGRHDRIVPRACAEQYVQALPNARLAFVENCGHFVDLERPDELERLVVDFAAES